MTVARTDPVEPTSRAETLGGAGSIRRIAVMSAHTLWAQRRAPLVWGFPVGLLGVLAVAIYPSIESADQIDQLVKEYPPAIKELFRLSQGPTLSTIEGYLAAELFNFVAPLALAFFPIRAAVGAIAGAEERGSLDVLLACPLARRELVAGSFIGTAVSLLEILAVVGSLTWLAAVVFGVDLSLGSTVAAVLNVWPLGVFFGGLALACSAVSHRPGRPLAISAFVALAMYFLDGLGNLSDIVEPLQPLSVFRHYGSAIETGIDWVSFGVIALLGAVLAALAAFAFERRDVYG